MVLLTALLVGCDGPAPPEWNEADGYRWAELDVPTRGEPGFRLREPGETGIDFVNEVERTSAQRNQVMAHGSGVTLGDVDGDGLVDVYLAAIEGPNALYRNLGGWSFEEVAAGAGVALPDMPSTGSAFADVDGDGDLDLLVVGLGVRNRLFLNDGSGAFTDVTERAGLADDERGSTTPAFADVDGDGDLDLYVANYKRRKADDIFPPNELMFDQVVRSLGDGTYRVRERFRDHFRIEEVPEGILRWEYAEPDRFYLNDGEGRFRPVSFTGGAFVDADGEALASAPDDWGLTARFQDVNGDGWPDLYVTNDFESEDRFWINRGDGTFEAVSPLALRTTSASSMAVDFSDVDRDGATDFLVVDMLAREENPKRKTQIPTIAPTPLEPGEIEPRVQRNRNTLFLNRGDGTYAEIARSAGIAGTDWSWGTAFLDVDLDGYEDVLVTTGHMWDVLDADVNTGLTNRTVTDDWQEFIENFPPLEQENGLFRNRGDGTFEDVSEAWGFSAGEDISHGLATADLDGDGDLDVVVNRLGSPAAVYENRSTAPRVTVRLVGRAPNTRGVGATIRLEGGPVPQQKQVTVGGLYLSSSDQTYTFAAGEGDGPLRLVVEWRAGGTSAVDGVRPDRIYEIREDAEVLRVPDPPTGPGADGPTGAGGGTLFEDATARLGHRHAEAEFNDSGRQPLLFQSFSRLGPGMTWHDADGDGDPDLYVSSGAGGRLSLMLNEGGDFRESPGGLPAGGFDQTTVLPLRIGGRDRLLVGRSNYEATGPEEALELPAVVATGLEGSGPGQPVVDAARSGTGPLAAADVDADGDLDLFVGGRVIPGVYPQPASSRLLLNEGGDLVPDESAGRALQNVGLVTGAVFTDVDADGDPDLVLATEWGPLRLFLNHLGRFSDVTDAWGLAEVRNRWNGVTAGDLDGDGRMDLVATAWGRNTVHAPTPDRPLRLYWGDFDGNGTLDMVEATRSERLDAMVPTADLEFLTLGLPTMRRQRIRTFEDYARATIDDVLGPAAATARFEEINTLDHMVFMNRGDSFEGRPLPDRAQVAPSFHVEVADFDGDGAEDVFLTQNFFALEVNLQRYDAGRGLLLRGDGAGGLVPVPGQRSGIRVYGDQRGAASADVDGDGRLDLVVSQNGADTRLFLNRRAEPGLRVRLQGPPENPDAVGATLRLVGADGSVGPAREVRRGSGHWSVSDPVQVLAPRDGAASLRVRWPDGSEEEVPVSGNAAEVTVAYRGAAAGEGGGS